MINVTNTDGEKFIPNIHVMWVADSTHQTPTESQWIFKYFLHCDTKAYVLEQKKFESGISSQDVTTCFTVASVAICPGAF